MGRTSSAPWKSEPLQRNQTILGFLARLRASLGWVALFLGGGCVVHIAISAWLYGLEAFRVPLVFPAVRGSLPWLLTAPLFFAAYGWARRRYFLLCGAWLAWGFFLLCLLEVMPRGVTSPGWHVQPLLIVLVSGIFGVLHGLSMALVAAASVAIAAWRHDPQLLPPAQTWVQALPLIVVVLSAGLLGSLLHKSMQAVLSIEVEQRQRLGAVLRALRQRERLLQHAMRIGTIGDMASMVVHQLRNQFQLMLGCVAVAERESATEKDRRLRQIRDTVLSASAMLEPLLQLAHPGEDRLERVDLGSCCAAVVERIRRILPASIDVQIETEDGLLVRVNPGDLEHALLNLIINAKQAMGRAGVLTIRAQRRDHAHVQLVVSDTGHGIAPEHRPNLFKPYFTTKPVGEGTGLGLAAVARFMRFAGGDVEVESEPGHGATFTLIFPGCAAGGEEQRVAG